MSSSAPFLPPHLLPGLAVGPARRRTLTAALLHSDVAGFTAMTERLQQRGRAGAEQVAEVINHVFSGAIDAIGAHAGSIVSFGGDSLFTIFPGDMAAARATAAAHAIEAAVRRRRTGSLDVTLSQAIHMGRVDELHLSHGARRHYLATGPAVAALARLGERAAPGVILRSAPVRAAAGRIAPHRFRADRHRVSAAPEAAIRSYLDPRLHPMLDSFDGDYRRVTVLFLETRGWSRPRLEALFGVLVDALESCAGTLLKSDLSPTGTKWLCVFGLPRVHEEDPERAARAALTVMAQAPAGLAVRGGVHVGIVASLAIGDHRRRCLDVMGDVVNTAARAMSRAAWGEVLTTDAARRQMPHVATLARGSHRVKGKRAALELHALTAMRDRPTPTSSVTLVGRARELSTMATHLREAVRGHGTTIGLRAAAGMGKTRIVQNAAARARSRGFDVHVVQAAFFDRAPHATLARLLRRLLELPDDTHRSAALAHAGREVRSAGLPSIDRHYLADLLGFRADDSPLERMEPRRIRDNALLCLGALVAARARRHPQLLAIDDLHLSDPLTRETLSWLRGSIGELPVVLLLAYRPDPAAPPVDNEIVLDELDHVSVRRLVARLHHRRDGALAASIAARAGGNPLYVGELVRHHSDTGRGSAAASDLPDSIEAVVEARLDRLPISARRIAALASVVGGAFEPSLLRRVSAAPTANLRADLDTLVAHDVLEVRPHGARVEYAFRQELIREVAYATILERRRRVLHGGVARVLARRADPGGSDEAAIADHLSRAGQPAQARRHYLAAARHAARTYALPAARDLYQRFLELAPRPTHDRVYARCELARLVLRPLGQRSVAEGQLEAALDDSRQLGDRTLEAQTARELGVFYINDGRLDDAGRLYDLALRRAREVGDRRIEGAVLVNLGNLAMRRLEPARGRRLLERSLAVLKRKRDLDRHAVALGSLADLEYSSGNTRLARDLYDRAIRIVRELDDPPRMAMLLGNIVIVLMDLGMLDEASATVHEALRLDRRVGDRVGEGIDLSNLASIQRRRGYLAEAERLGMQALEIHRETRLSMGIASTLHGLGNVLGERGRWRAARKRFEESLALVRRESDFRAMPQVYISLAHAEAKLGRLERARGFYREADALSRRAEDRRRQATIYYHLAELESWIGSPRAAVDALLRAGERARGPKRRDEPAPELECRHGHILLSRGSSARALLRRLETADPDGALASLERAQAAFEKGEPLLVGYLPADLRPAIRRWLRVNRGLQPAVGRRPAVTPAPAGGA